MSKEWIFPTTQEKPEIKIAYGSKRVKPAVEIKTSKYFDIKDRKENPIYLREEEFGSTIQRGGAVYILNKPATLILKKYLNGYRGGEIRILRDIGMVL